MIRAMIIWGICLGLFTGTIAVMIITGLELISVALEILDR